MPDASKAKNCSPVSVEKIRGTAAQADHIASRTIKAINVKMRENPVYYKKLAELIKETIAAYHQKRIEEAEYLKRAKEQEDKFFTENIEKLLNDWYKTKAIHHFTKFFEANLFIAKQLYEGKPILKYRWMQKRWGSCDKNGQIHLNLELIKAPKKCIEYVIIHEICHLAHLNHSMAFYQLLDKNYPDWRATKDRLERMMV